MSQKQLQINYFNFMLLFTSVDVLYDHLILKGLKYVQNVLYTVCA